ncbi:hypothetical protein CDAR_249721 [Caerostris darwini]|uniref:Uncharacterized protein n=1 Tax=Caerostris darwini TaxID=1538125 RepID=A0AAV4SAJ2_9ARAC|nr:hypothetical protein CDAR_249721 [Caerostris darwini]
MQQKRARSSSTYDFYFNAALGPCSSKHRLLISMQVKRSYAAKQSHALTTSRSRSMRAVSHPCLYMYAVAVLCSKAKHPMHSHAAARVLMQAAST